MKSYLLAFVIIFLLMVAWISIQSVWKRIFSGIEGDADVLAARGDCHGCDDKECCHDGADIHFKLQSKTCENEEHELKNLA